MELRPSGKIAIAIIAALGTIGGLHVMIFKDRAEEYGEARQQYESASSQFASQGTAPDINEIHRFRYHTLKYDLDYWRVLRELRIAIPEFYGVGFARLDEFERRQRAWDTLRELEELREKGREGEGTRLTFLGERGWNLIETLPAMFTQQGVAVEDEMERLKNEDRLLRNLSPGTTVYQARRNSYRQMMANLGVNPDTRNTLSTRFGDYAGMMLTLNRIDQILGNLPEDFFIGFDENNPNEDLTEEERLNAMYRLFQITWPKAAGNPDEIDWIGVQRQGEALVQIIEAATLADVSEISAVRMHPYREIRWKDRDAEEEEEPEDQMFDMFAFDDYMMFGGMGGEFGDPAMMGMDMGMGMGMGMQREPDPEDPPTAIGGPVEVVAVGTNAAIMNWLFRLVRGQNPLELDRLTVRVNNQGEVRATAFFNVVTYAHYLGIMTEEEIDYRINQVSIEIAELALERPGAREPALADGLIRLEDDMPVLVNPTPTPWAGEIPDPPATPEPEPAPGMEPGMMPGMDPGMMDPGMQPGMQPGAQPGMDPGMQPGMQQQPGMEDFPDIF